MRLTVQDYVRSCAACQGAKSLTQKSQGLLQTLPIPSKPWDELSMDFVVALPNSNGFTAVFVVVDRLTKGAHFIPLRPNFTASIVSA